MAEIPALERARQGYCFEFPAILGYTVNSKLHLNTQQAPSFKKPGKDARCGDTWL